MRKKNTRLTHNAEILLVGKKGELILQQRDDKPGISNPGLITTFGGGLENGESELDAAYRELQEETSLRIPRDRFIRYGNYLKTKQVHGEDWTVTYFVVRDVEYKDMKVFEGQKYVVIKGQSDLSSYKTSKLFREFAEDWYSGWRDFLFMPDPPSSVIKGIVTEIVKNIDNIDSTSTPILFCPIGLVGSGKTSVVSNALRNKSRLIISSDKIRTAIYEKGYNFTNVLNEILERIIDVAISKRVNIFFDSNAASKLSIVQKVEHAGYKVMVFYVNPSENYIEAKLQKLSWDLVPERFTFFKEPRHVLVSYHSNKNATKDLIKRFMKEYSPDFIINPEHLSKSLINEVTRKIEIIEKENA